MARLGSTDSRSPANSATRMTTHDRDHLPQPPLQYFAQDARPAREEGRETAGDRIPEDAAHGGGAERAPGKARHDAARALAQEGGEGSWPRQAGAHGRPAHR